MTRTKSPPGTKHTTCVAIEECTDVLRVNLQKEIIDRLESYYQHEFLAGRRVNKEKVSKEIGIRKNALYDIRAYMLSEYNLKKLDNWLSINGF